MDDLVARWRAEADRIDQDAEAHRLMARADGDGHVSGGVPSLYVKLRADKPIADKAA